MIGLSHLVLSNFSHIEIWHFGLNMVAFSSFAGGLMCEGVAALVQARVTSPVLIQMC